MIDSIKKDIPSAICLKCWTPYRDIRAVDALCQKVIGPGSKRCHGDIASRNNNGDWEECTSCNAAGRVDNAQCVQCEGFGWLHSRGK